MVYLPQDIMTKILEYCDDRVEQRQRRLKGKVLDVIYRNKDTIPISNIIEYLTNDDYDEPITQAQVFLEYYEEHMIGQSSHHDLISYMNETEYKSSMVCKKYNINTIGKTHLDIIREAEDLLNQNFRIGINDLSYEIIYNRILKVK